MPKYEVIYVKQSRTRVREFTTATLAELFNLELMEQDEVETIIIRPKQGPQICARMFY
jgi:hypothetical protein